MNISIRRTALAASLLLLFSLVTTQFATAAEARYFSATDFVSPGSELTYFDLALQFAPALAKTPMDGGDISKLPHIGGDEEPTTLTKPELGSIERLDLKLNGRPAALMMFDLGYADESVASVNIVALFDLSTKPRLLDAMDVGLDRETSFLEPGYLELSTKFGMAFVRNSHHNAGEEYLQTSIIGIWDNKLHDVDTVFSMSWFVGYEELTVRPSFAPVKEKLALDATFSIRRKHCESTCVLDADYPSMTERVKARYSWDAAAGKFVRPEEAYNRIPQPDGMEE